MVQKNLYSFNTKLDELPAKQFIQFNRDKHVYIHTNLKYKYNHPTCVQN